MNKAKLTFLGSGTSQGVPMIGCDCEVCKSADPRDKRLRASVLVEYGGLTILVDAGPDFRYQMLRQDVRHIDTSTASISRRTPPWSAVSSPSPSMSPTWRTP